jgi:adenylate kinase family enzyme
LLVFGAPGVGKGTYSKLMEKEFNFKTFSMGDYFRGIINREDTQNDEFV